MSLGETQSVHSRCPLPELLIEPLGVGTASEVLVELIDHM